MPQVGVSTTNAPLSMSSTSTSPAIPTQSGLASNCNKIIVAQKGDTCFSFAQSNGAAPFLMKLPVIRGAGAATGLISGPKC